jgi:uncharacterized protein YbjT (DUF2867 family)
MPSRPSRVIPKASVSTTHSCRRHAGDALNAADVSEAVTGHDAVLVVLGAGMSRRSRIRSEGTLNVIRAMQAHGPKRLIVQSTLGARDSWDTLNFWWKRVMFGALARPGLP